MIKEFVIQNMSTVLIYIIIINVIGFLSMGIDKFKAKNQMWRTKERTLVIIAMIGGSIGSIIGMYVFRHKTKHGDFVLGMPLIFIGQVILIIYLFF